MGLIGNGFRSITGGALLLASYSKYSTIMASPLEGSGNVNYKQAQSIYDFTAVDIDGNTVSLDRYKGHVCIIVNVASK
ncbi:putative Glutathione peroxidase [Daphnia magna]|uniref:Putative Glutathione peroxidase n=3 Tax=Daphnia magna TaxID=35525 RepID=A0A164NQP3_9CRUS|nr:putative Glutathione peroxidase [Daphnia magna]